MSVRLVQHVLDQDVLEGVGLRDPDAVGKKVRLCVLFVYFPCFGGRGGFT
jgi:hypothetical protein